VLQTQEGIRCCYAPVGMWIRGEEGANRTPYNKEWTSVS